MFDSTSEQFRNQVIDLSNQISVFRRVTVTRNQELLNEEERFNNQIASMSGDKTNVENIHFLYVKEEKEHIMRDIKSELLYLNVLGKTYNDARARVVELAKKINTVEDKDEKKAIRDELKVVLPFVEMYESYYKELKSMQAALDGYEHNNDRYLDYIKANVDTFKDVKNNAQEAKTVLKEKELTFDLTLTEDKLSIMAGYDNIKLDAPEEFDLSVLTPEDIDYFLINFLENVAKNNNMSYDELAKKKFNVKLNGQEIKNVNDDTFTNTVLAYVSNQRKDNKDRKEEEQRVQNEIESNVPDKPAEKEVEKPRKAARVPKTVVDAPTNKLELQENEQGEILNIDRILADLTKGLDLAKGDDWKFSASNIRVNQNFKKKVCTGNVLYNIVALAPSVVSYPFQLIHKGIGKIAYNKKIDTRVKQLQERLLNLSEEELRLLYENYKGGNLRNYNKMPVVNTMIQARITAWIKQKTKKITARMVSIYNTILKDFKRMTEISKIIKEQEISEAEYNSLSEEYFALTYGKADLIREYLELSKEKLDYEVGGAKGFSDSIQAFKTGMSQAGFRFRRIPKENDEINEAQAKAYEEELKGVANNDDVMALSGFVKREKIISDNSEIEELLFMDREAGLRSYNPVMKPLNYEKDPFVSDLMRTVVLVASGINLYTTIQRAHELDNLKELTETQNQVIQDQQQRINNYATEIQHAKDLSQGITEKSQAVIDSRVAQINEANLAHTNTLERAVLDQTNWHSTGETYRALDDAAHATYNSAYQASQAEINAIADGVSNGTLTHSEAMAKLTELSKNMEDQFVANYKDVYNTVTTYATEHPQFDLTAPTEGLGKVIDTSANINVGNQAIDEAFKMAEEISNIPGTSLAEIEALATNLSKIEALSGVAPTQSMIPGLFNSLSAAALAIGVKNRMIKYNSYGFLEDLENVDEITDDDIKDYEINVGLKDKSEAEEEITEEETSGLSK